jgi:hypothetical protein
MSEPALPVGGGVEGGGVDGGGVVEGGGVEGGVVDGGGVDGGHPVAALAVQLTGSHSAGTASGVHEGSAVCDCTQR